ncbi:MAG: DNA primase DnaG [Desulfurococcaceae archaeon]
MVKYLIRARVEVEGIVDKHDIIGAIFGQTEGLFGEQFDLRVLQEKGRIGRITVSTKSKNGKTIGLIQIPSSLDRVETALLVALIESVDKVGPYDAKITLVDIIDIRVEKIKKIVERAAEIIERWFRGKAPDLKEILSKLQEKLKIPEPITYGPENLPAGPDIDKSDTVIVVEGRADVVNLLRYGYGNVIAIEGARRIPETVKELSKKKKTIVLLDGDHAGDLILKEILRTIKVDYIARAPRGKEVEELTQKELVEVLEKAVSIKDYLSSLSKEEVKDIDEVIRIQEELHGVKLVELEKPRIEETISIPNTVLETMKSLIATSEAIVYDDQWNAMDRIPVRDLVPYLDTSGKKVHAIVFDGVITQRLLDKGVEKGVKVIVGARLGRITYKYSDIVLLTFNDLLSQS